MREASAIMSKGTSNLVKARAKLAILEKAEKLANKALTKAQDLSVSATNKAEAQRAKVLRMTTTPAERAAANTELPGDSAKPGGEEPAQA